MNCMKCGVELKNDGVFCEECLADMAHYPVKPNITVNLPPHSAAHSIKRRSRRVRHVKAEDQIRHLKQVRNWLFILLLSALLALTVAIAAIVHLSSDPAGLPLSRTGETTSEAT